MIFTELVITAYVVWWIINTYHPSISLLNVLTITSAGAYLGVIGGCFNGSINNTHKIIGFSIWECSNLILALWAHSVGQFDLMYMYIFYNATSTFGLYSHVKKHVEDRRKKNE